MKKLKSLFIAIIMILSISLLTGCGIGKIVGNGEVGEESLEYSIEETQKKIKKLSETNGIEIKVKYESASTGEDDEVSYSTFGIKDGVYWSIDGEDDGTAFKISEDSKHAYMYYLSGDEWYYDYTIDVTDDTLASFEYYFGLSGWLYFGHAYDGMLNKTGTTKVAGRDCNVYKYKLNLIVEKMEYTLAIDKETGVTMKYDLGARVVGESASMGFEVTSFKTSGINAPVLPEPEIEDNYDDEGDYPLVTPGSNDSRYDQELRVTSQSDLECIENHMLVAKYTGDNETLLEDDLWITDFGTLDIYWVWVGFYSDGTTNRVSGGYTCLYYFFDDVDAYNQALEEARQDSFFRGFNNDHLYFTMRTYDMDGDTYEEMRQTVIDGDYRHPNFTLVE